MAFKRSISLFAALLSLSSMAQAAVSFSNSNTVPKITPKSSDNDPHYKAPYFPLLGFKEYENNPILSPNPDNNWESAFLYNPSAIVVDDTIFLLYRAQNTSKTSSIGLAWSKDGYNFTRYNKPVIQATEPYEAIGGCEDPRVIRVNGTFYATYTGYDNTTARLCLATSTDLVNWTKYGPILPNVTDIILGVLDPTLPYTTRVGWSKSGAILNERQPDGTYHMHFGDSFLYLATSKDLIHWDIEDRQPPYAPKLNVWEQVLMESAAPPVKTRDGMWLKFYNGVSSGIGGYVLGQYSTGQMLIDPVNLPRGPPIARIETPVLTPTSVHEVTGQVDNVVFSEGLVQYRGKWFLYFGQGDAFLGVATTDVQP